MSLLVPKCVNFRRFAERGGGALRLAILAALLVPLVDLASLHRLGLPSALACSAGGAVAPAGPRFFVIGAQDSNELAVAHDGFFVIVVDGSYDTPAAYLSALDVQVTNAAGEAIAGTLQILATPNVLSWVANAPLADATYTATVAIPSNVQDAPTALKLHASGERAPLAPAVVSPRAWLRYHRLTGGTRVSCGMSDGCRQVMLGEIEETTLAADVGIGLPAINGQVFWEVTVDYVGSADPVQSWRYALLSRSVVESRDERSLPEGQSEYCFQVTTRDLRDAQELRSSPVCFQPESVREVDDTTVLGQCPAPPSPALTARWCQQHAESTLPACVALHEGGAGGGAGVGGGASGGASGGEPSVPQVSAGAAGSAPNQPLGNDDRTAGACSIGHSTRAAAAGSAWLFALAAALGLRRRKAGMGRP